MGRIDDLNRFYTVLDGLRQRLGGYRLLRDCTGNIGWPERGVYLFFEDGETREDRYTHRVTRVGTHAITATSQTTLWNRLHTHRGQLDGGGNHRASIFRKRIGEAFLQLRDYPDEVRRTWGMDNSASGVVRRAESRLEEDVSRYICKMPFLWLEVNDAPSPASQRAYIERNSIALLSNFGRQTIDPPSANWVGNHSPQPTIQQSGLWNTKHVNERYDPHFLDVLADLVARRETLDTHQGGSPLGSADESWDEQRLAKIRELIRQLYSVVSELEREFEGRKFTPDGHLVGSIGEVVAAYAFGLKLLPASNEIHDAEAADGTPVQIKLTGGTKGISMYSEPVHLIVLQLSGNAFRTVYNGPGKPAWERCGTVQKNGQKTVSLTLLRGLDNMADRKLPQIRKFPTLD